MVAKKKTAKKKKRTIKRHPRKGTIPRSKVKKAVAKVFEQAKKKKREFLAWHLIPRGMRLGYNDGRKVVPGEWIEVDYEPEMCQHGLHASARILKALEYADMTGVDRRPKIILCRVKLGGKVIGSKKDKYCARRRKVLWCIDARKVLKEYALKMGCQRQYFKLYTLLRAVDCSPRHNEKLLLRMVLKEAGKQGVIKKRHAVKRKKSHAKKNRNKK